MNLESLTLLDASLDIIDGADPLDLAGLTTLDDATIAMLAGGADGDIPNTLGGGFPDLPAPKRPWWLMAQP